MNTVQVLLAKAAMCVCVYFYNVLPVCLLFLTFFNLKALKVEIY